MFCAMAAQLLTALRNVTPDRWTHISVSFPQGTSCLVSPCQCSHLSTKGRRLAQKGHENPAAPRPPFEALFLREPPIWSRAGHGRALGISHTREICMFQPPIFAELWRRDCRQFFIAGSPVRFQQGRVLTVSQTSQREWLRPR
jgi:hypothetical protein